MKTAAANAAGVFALLVLVVLGSQGQLILTGVAIGLAVGVTLLIYLGPDRLGILALLVAVFLSPINGLKVGSGNVTFADFAYVAGIGLLLPRMLQSTSKMPRLYTIGVWILVLDALVVSLLSPIALVSLLGFVRVFYAIVIIPVVMHRLRMGFHLLNAFAWAFVLGQIVSMAKGTISYGIHSSVAGGRGVGWTTHPNFYGLGGQLAFALLVFLFYRTPRQYRWIVVGAAVLCALSVYQSGSRASLLCITLTVLLWPVVERTAISVYVLTSFALVAAVVLNYLISTAPEGSSLARLKGGGTSQGSNQARELLLSQGWEKFWASPIKGNGWSDILAYHNAYLEVAVAGGVFAVVGFVFVIAAHIKPLFDEPVPNRLAFVALSYAAFAAIGPTVYDRVLWGALGLVFALHRTPDDPVPEDELRARPEKKPLPALRSPGRIR
ncbi:MAG: O-antigen ligase family protein [Nocardioidaceae bacterium]|nr:O-antigen ligase family protein [Nocardioidaceae bacterium]